MAIHYSVSSIVQESLVEKMVLTIQAIEYRKDPNSWGSPGCLGHPALTLLMSIIDTIGSFVLDGSVRNHFNILNHPDHYNLQLSSADIDIIYKCYRNLQTHNSVLGLDCVLHIGEPTNQPFTRINNKPTIFLVPLYNATIPVVDNFLQNAEKIIPSSKQFREIIKI